MLSRCKRKKEGAGTSRIEHLRVHDVQLGASVSLCPGGIPLERRVVLSLQQTFPCNRVPRWLSVDGDLWGRAVDDLFMGRSAKQVRVQERKIKVCSL